MWLWNDARSAYGTPSSSQIISAGTGCAYAATRSVGEPCCSIASRWSVQISTSRSVSWRIRRTVNRPTSSRRNRVCSGASIAVSVPGGAGGGVPMSASG